MRQDGVIPYFSPFYNEELSHFVIAIEICKSCLTFNENFRTL